MYTEKEIQTLFFMGSSKKHLIKLVKNTMKIKTDEAKMIVEKSLFNIKFTC